MVVEIQKMIKLESDNGFSHDETKQLSDVFQEFKDIFRTTFPSPYTA